MELTSERISLRDSLEAVNRLFYGRGWTDGLPVVPPTEERVAEMLTYADLSPDHVVAELPPRWGEATVEKLAINAVMAGCLPTYFPVIVAAIHAMSESPFNLYGIQTTTHPCAPLVIVNGPIAGELDINGGYNAFGPGWRANATIGRAIRLILMNVGGGIPGRTDRATQGQPSKYSFCIAENEEANPWNPFHVERGHGASTSTVTVVGGESPHNINDHVSKDAVGILTTVADSMAIMGANNTYAMGEPLVCLGPEHAAIIAEDGWTKEEVKGYLFEHARKPRGRLKLGGMWGMFKGPRIFDTQDDSALLPICERREDIMVIVVGGAGRHSSWVPTFGFTRAVTRPIALRNGVPASTVENFRHRTS